MLFAGLVVAEGFLRQRRIDRRAVDRPYAVRSGRRLRDDEFQRGEQRSGVPVPEGDQALPGLRRQPGFPRSQSDGPVRKGPVQDPSERVVGQRLQQHEDRAGQKRADHFERGILGRRADQDDRAPLDVRKKRILLSLVEAMDLVDEEHRLLALERQPVLRGLDDLPQLGNAPRHRRKRHEMGLRVPGDEMRQRRLARPRRPPKNHGGETIRLDGLPQRAVRRGDLVLPDKIGEFARAHPFRQRHLRRSAARGHGEEIGARVARSRHHRSLECGDCIRRFPRSQTGS